MGGNDFQVEAFFYQAWSLPELLTVCRAGSWGLSAAGLRLRLEAEGWRLEAGVSGWPGFGFIRWSFRGF